MTDVEYADDTVLVSRTQLTLHRLLHSLQHEASKRGLLLNPGKCQLLRLHSNLSIHPSPHVTPLSPCSCLHCMGTDDLGVQIPPLHSAKYLGAYVAANASSAPDCNYRYSQAMGAFRCLFPVFTNPSLPSRRKLQVYAQIVLAILLYMAVNLKFLPLLRSQGSILFTIRFRDKSFKLNALITIGSFTPLRRTVPMNTCSPLPTVCPPAPDTQPAYFCPAIALPRSYSSAF